jgi:hypothetical protein
MFTRYEVQQDVTCEFEYDVMNAKRLLTQFEPISLAEMDAVALLNRTDTKYVMRVSQLQDALRSIVDQYQVLGINHSRLNHYQTLYFDTPDFELYRQHHNGSGSRYKVRAREYVESDLAFFEVKYKTNQGRTIKCRIRTPDVLTHLDGQVSKFVAAHTPINGQELEPKLWNRFLRVTLVSKHRPERLTLDLNLEFGWGDAYVALPGIAVAEVKQEHFSTHSDFIQQMRRLGIRSAQFSKYCAGIYLLYDNIKINNFKMRMRLVDKLMQEEMGHVYVR